MKAPSYKTCVTPPSSSSIRAKATAQSEQTVTTIVYIEAFLSWVLPAKLSPACSLSDCKQWLTAVYPKSPCGFRAGRSTTDMIFTVRQLQEKSREQGKPLYLAFIDLTKAFDLVIRKGLFQLLEKIGCSSTLINQWLSPTTKAWWAPCMKSGVKQGCVLSPTLFGIFFSSSCPMPLTLPPTVCLQGGSPPHKTKAKTVLVRDVHALCWWCCLGNTSRDSNAEAHQQIRQQVRKLWPHWISLKKTNVSMSAQDICQAPEMKIGDHNLDLINEFTYLGSTISIWTRALTQKSPEESAKPAVLYMSKLKKESLEKQIPDWEHQNVYLLGMRSHGALLYGSELGPPKWDRQPLELFPFAIPQAHPRRQVAMQDHITNSEILSRAGIPSMPSFRSQRRLGWLGHVHCMDDGLIPKEVLFGQLKTGVRKAAGVPPRGSWKLTNVTSKHAKLIQAIGTMLLVNVPEKVNSTESMISNK